VNGAGGLRAHRHPVLDAVLYQRAFLAAGVVEADALYVLARLGACGVLRHDNTERGLIDSPHALHSNL